jgi:RNA polymerase sigma-70 factor (ECF subfamily)
MLHAYPDLLRYARRVSKRADEAEDLLQSVLLAAVRQGRADLALDSNRRWLMGALRRHAAFEARSALRRRRRDAIFVPHAAAAAEDADFQRLCAALPPALRTTARLIASGHTKAEILWLLRISDMAFRQRVVDIRRRLGTARFSADAVEGLAGRLSFGLIRRDLIMPVRLSGAFLASHDPDGHTFILGSASHIRRPRQQGAATSKENQTHVCKP